MADKKVLEDMRIDILPNGPIKVSGGVPLTIMSIVRNEHQEAIGWQEGEAFSQKDVYMLCRCGHSKNKPFCDGAHAAAGFDGTEQAAKEPFEAAAQQIRGEGLTLHDNVKLCIGAEFCDRFGGVWNLVQVTEENSGLENPEEAAKVAKTAREIATEQACLCPSGRLVMHRKVDEHDEIIEADFDQPSIALIQDPVFQTSAAIWVRGNIPIYCADGEPYEVRNRITLCRCGASVNKPFCDGAHYRINFDDGLQS